MGVYLLQPLQSLDFILLFLLQSFIDVPSPLSLLGLRILDNLQAILKLSLSFFHLEFEVIDLGE